MMTNSYPKNANQEVKGYQFNKKPIDSTVKVYKASDLAKGDAKPKAYIIPPVVKQSTKGMSLNKHLSIEKDDRKLKLQLGIQNRTIQSIDDAVAVLNVSDKTIRSYINEMDLKVPTNFFLKKEF